MILTRQQANPLLQRLLAAPRTIRNAPSEVVLERDDGMPDRCALNFDDITTIAKSLFVERICRLGIDRLDAVCRTLRIAAAC